MGHFIPHSNEAKRKMVKNHIGMAGSKQGEETIKKIIDAQKGIPRPRGSNAPNWKGGRTAEYKLIRGSIEWKIWREKVFKRDNYLCQMPSCTHSEKFLEPHHIKKFSKYRNLRFDVNNGVTLCRVCHNKTKGKEASYEQIFSFYFANKGETNTSGSEGSAPYAGK